MLRIIAGQLKGRRIEVPKNAVRPTSNRAREAVFNVLMHWPREDGQGVIRDARVVDVCSGSGALAYEAISRGAAHATLIDKDPKVLAVAEGNATHLGVAAQCCFLRMDATQLPQANATFDLAFLDPPYAEGIVTAMLEGLHLKGWLSPGAIVVCERGHNARFAVPPAFESVLQRRYGAAEVFWLEYTP